MTIMARRGRCMYCGHDHDKTPFHTTSNPADKAEIARLQSEVAAALPAMREYARRNPVHHFGETPQDPNGAHAWLDRNDAARKEKP